MNKKSAVRKTLVRNTVINPPKVKVILEDKNPKKCEMNRPVKEKSKTTDSGSNFQCPELQTTLGISKKIDLVEKAKPKKVKDIPNLAFDEKMTRKVNFPFDQPIYKDLIPLDVPVKSQPVLTSREPFQQRDQEPSLANFVQPKKVKEFIYQPTIKFDDRTTVPKLNNLRLTKILQIHES